MLTLYLDQFVLSCENIKSNKQIMVNAIESKHKIVFKFFTTIGAILNNGETNFSVFHFFGDQTFINFMKSVLNFIFLVEPTIDSFPNKKTIFYNSLEEICISIPDLIIEFGEPIYVENIMRILMGLFQKNMEEVYSNVDTKNIYDDTNINMIHTILVKLGTHLYEEILLDPHSATGLKCINCKNTLVEIMKDFVICTIEATFNINYTTRINNILGDIVQTFLCLDKENNIIICSLREWLLGSIAKCEVDVIFINSACDNLKNGIGENLDHYSRDEFYGIFKEFCELLIKNVIRKNSNLYSGAYIDRLQQESEQLLNNNST